jgi:drug/metabolite transporter (DMT)-like permease
VNWASSVPASRRGVHRPARGAHCSACLLGEPLSIFTVIGGVLVVGGLWATMRQGA